MSIQTDWGKSAPRILILGAGCTGLGAAYRLHELGYTNFQVIERESHPGGLATSFVDSKGFTWDLGGHVQFSHYDYFDRLMNIALGTAWLHHVRQSYIWIRGKFVPYPFQNNLRHLPTDDLLKCVKGLISARNRSSAPLTNFHDWIVHSFGEGIAEVFMLPYNFKVWAYPAEEMSHLWVGERVATVDLERVVENVITGRDDPGWGPNNTFRFPEYGGTGAIWKAVEGLIPRERLKYNANVSRIDGTERKVYLDDGCELPYDVLISTLPLDLMPAIVGVDSFRKHTDRLKFSTTHVVGLGLNGHPPASLATKNWMYFPEPDCPFYRVTVFSNYSPNNVPDPSRQWSLMAEVSESPVKPVAQERVLRDVVSGALATGLIESEKQIESTWQIRLPHGYPTPTVDRDEHLDAILPALERMGIYSRGRFGAWKYEVANQDHTCMQGVEIVDRLLRGIPEMTVTNPNVVNAPKAKEQSSPLAETLKNDPAIMKPAEANAPSSASTTVSE
jgi:protoporphyrinogen oxidase